MVTLDIVKDHLRLSIADTFEDTVLQIYLDSAVEYVSTMTGIDNDILAPKSYDLAVMLLVAHRYANREMVSDGPVKSIPYGFDMLMQSLRPATGLI